MSAYIAISVFLKKEHGFIYLLFACNYSQEEFKKFHVYDHWFFTYNELYVMLLKKLQLELLLCIKKVQIIIKETRRFMKVYSSFNCCFFV